MTTPQKKPDYIDRFFDAFSYLWDRLNEKAPYRRTVAEVRAHPSTISDIITGLVPPHQASGMLQRTAKPGIEVATLATPAGTVRMLSLPTWRPFGTNTLDPGLVMVMNDLGAAEAIIDMNTTPAEVYMDRTDFPLVIESRLDPMQAPTPARCLAPMFAQRRRTATWNF